MRIALDTNVLAYAEGIDGPERQQRTWEILEPLAERDTLFVPTQVLGELFNVIIKKGHKDRNAARRAILGWRDSFDIIDIRAETTLSAIDLSADHAFSIWDAVIMAASAQAGCRILLSEDMQDGFTWSGLTVVNPFADPLNPLLADYLTK